MQARTGRSVLRRLCGAFGFTFAQARVVAFAVARRFFGTLRGSSLGLCARLCFFRVPLLQLFARACLGALGLGLPRTANRFGGTVVGRDGITGRLGRNGRLGGRRGLESACLDFLLFACEVEPAGLDFQLAGLADGGDARGFRLIEAAIDQEAAITFGLGAGEVRFGLRTQRLGLQPERIGVGGVIVGEGERRQDGEQEGQAVLWHRQFASNRGRVA